ncbi:hypothetical protein SALBM311S_00791 [Streptomyces alboniger]
MSTFPRPEGVPVWPGRRCPVQRGVHRAPHRRGTADRRRPGRGAHAVQAVAAGGGGPVAVFGLPGAEEDTLQTIRLAVGQDAIPKIDTDPVHRTTRFRGCLRSDGGCGRYVVARARAAEPHIDTARAPLGASTALEERRQHVDARSRHQGARPLSMARAPALPMSVSGTAVSPPSGTITEEARTTQDASGLVLAPGFVDPHNRTTTPSCSGTPGRQRPPQPRSDDRRRRQLRVHPRRPTGWPRGRRLHPPGRRPGGARPAAGLQEAWSWHGLQYLDALEGRIAVNAGFTGGHCALRRYVMGPDAIGGQPSGGQAARADAPVVPRGDGRGRLGSVHHPVVHPLRR